VRKKQDKPMNAQVAAVFATYSPRVQKRLMNLRQMIFDVAEKTEGVGELEETLRWGQPGYVTSKSKSGSLIRIDQINGSDGQYAMYFICHTNLAETFRERYRDKLAFEGNRCLVFHQDEDLPVEELEDCISMALTYHQKQLRR